MALEAMAVTLEYLAKAPAAPAVPYLLPQPVMVVHQEVSQVLVHMVLVLVQEEMARLLLQCHFVALFVLFGVQVVHFLH
jgi:hypothetical protein